MYLSNNIKPFIKWVGGKGQLLKQLEAALPIELYKEKFTYIEPFVGGGAMLFYMLQKFPNIEYAVINDINGKLTDAYETIKNDAEGLITSLKNIEQEYYKLGSEEERKTYYLSMRNKFNKHVQTKIEKTALFIFLNRTCFNGLYRENSKGEFNVPFGRYTNPTICNEEVILADSRMLNERDVIILNGDFKQTEKYTSRSGLNFFYFDPPYRPLSATSSFNSYVKEEFNDESQRDLAEFCHCLSKNDNCLWMLSNSDCSAKNSQDTFFEDIYRDFYILRVYASRSVNAIASKRGKLTELLIRNYHTIPNNQEQQLFNQIV